jgi:hypothetical protein
MVSVGCDRALLQGGGKEKVRSVCEKDGQEGPISEIPSATLRITDLGTCV